MRSRTLVVAVAIAVGPTSLPHRALAQQECLLLAPEASALPASSCRPCHAEVGPAHPVDLDYGPAALRAPAKYRSEQEVVARGVLLPQGRIQCVSCHDGRSTAQYKIAILPGALEATFRTAPAGYRSSSTRYANGTPAGDTGTAIRTLCVACHKTADRRAF